MRLDGLSCDATKTSPVMKGVIEMKNFVKGVLSLWTVLTTIWTIITFGLIGGAIEGLCEENEDLNERARRPVSYKSYHDHS